MPFNEREAARIMMEGGATDDDVRTTLGAIRSQAKDMMTKGMSDQQVESIIAQTKWKDKPIFKSVAAEKPEKPGFFENVKEEFGQGVRTMLTPSEAPVPGGEWLRKKGVIGETMANVVGSALGGAQAAFAVPSAAAKTYIGEPLREAGYPKLGTAAEIATGIGLSFAGAPIRAAGAAAKYAPGIIKGIGTALDPLSAVGAAGAGLKAKIAGREAHIAETGTKVGAETAKLTEAQQAFQGAQAGRAGLESELAAMRPPVTPVAPERFAQGLIKPEAEVARGAERAAETFAQTKVTATENLFNQSSANYKALEAKYGGIPVPVDDVKQISNAVADAQEALRGTSAMKAIQAKTGAMEPTVHGQSIAGLGPDAVRFIEAQLSSGMGLKVGDLMQMRARLVAQNRSLSDIGAINANKGIISTIDDAMSRLPQQAGKDFQQAKVFHQYVHDVVGPESITNQIFHQSPENVVKNIFLPEGKTAPNIEAIRMTKEMFQRVLPEGWTTMSKQALAEFGSRIKDAKTGTLDVQRFNREFNKFEGAFREALPPTQFQAMQDFRNIVHQFNQESALFRSAQAGLKQQITEAGKGVAQAKHVVTAQGAVLRGAKTEAAAAKSQSKYASSTVQQFASPYAMMALAQVGQAVQATFTGSYAAASRQLAQGVVWYTLGNPDFITKMLGSPKLSKSLSVIASGQGQGPKVVNAGRMLYEAMQEGTEGQ